MLMMMLEEEYVVASRCRCWEEEEDPNSEHSD
jgi:hypothetical protein